jgi:hypothetical protein
VTLSLADDALGQVSSDAPQDKAVFQMIAASNRLTGHDLPLLFPRFT